MNTLKRTSLLQSQEDSSKKRPKILSLLLENEIESLRAELEHERSLREIDQRRAAQTKARLERQVKFASEEAEEAKSLLEDLRATSEEHVKALREARQEALSDLRECQATLAEYGEQLGDEYEIGTAREKIVQLEAQLEARKEEVDSLNLRLKEVIQDASQLRTRSTAVGDATQDANQTPICEPSVVPDAVMRELNTARIALAESERKLRQLHRKSEDWNKKAKQLVHQKEVSASTTLRNTKLEQDVNELHRELESHRATHAQWMDFVREIGEMLNLTTSGPPEVATVMRHLQKQRQHANIMETEVQSLKVNLTDCKEQIVSLRKSLREAAMSTNQSQRNLKNVQKELDQAKINIQVLQSQEHIWQREADSLRTLLTSFDDILPGQSGLNEDATSKSLQIALVTSREETALLRQDNDRLATELLESSISRRNVEKELDSVTEKFSRLRDALEDERNKTENAEDRAMKAETLAGKGSINPSVTRALHLEKNPLSDAIHERYRKEITVLKTKLEGLTGDNLSLTTTPLKPDVDPEKLHQRLKDTFKEQIGIFREGVYLITGYKVDMLLDKSTPYFKVRSVYAEREEDVLIFNWPKGVKQPKSLELRGTDYARLLSTTDSYEYLNKYESMPGFMASTQLVLLEKCTFISSAGDK